eukprot:3566066-Alexandrium_andersonii.AAC.1
MPDAQLEEAPVLSLPTARVNQEIPLLIPWPINVITIWLWPQLSSVCDRRRVPQRSPGGLGGILECSGGHRKALQNSGE